MEKRFKIEVLEDYRKNKGLSKTKFCKLCGVSYSVYKRLENQDLNIRTISFIKIVDFLGVKCRDLVDF